MALAAAGILPGEARRAVQAGTSRGNLALGTLGADGRGGQVGEEARVALHAVVLADRLLEPAGAARRARHAVAHVALVAQALVACSVSVATTANNLDAVSILVALTAAGVSDGALSGLGIAGVGTVVGACQSSTCDDGEHSKRAESGIRQTILRTEFAQALATKRVESR